MKHFNARAWWKFAYKCIKTSIQAKKGSIYAFKLGRKDLTDMETKFKPMFS